MSGVINVSAVERMMVVSMRIIVLEKCSPNTAILRYHDTGLSNKRFAWMVTLVQSVSSSMLKLSTVSPLVA
jgi:hypothetical protein